MSRRTGSKVTVEALISADANVYERAKDVALLEDLLTRLELRHSKGDESMAVTNALQALRGDVVRALNAYTMASIKRAELCSQ